MLILEYLSIRLIAILLKLPRSSDNSSFLADSFERDNGSELNESQDAAVADLSMFSIGASSLLDVYLKKRSDENRLFMDEFKVGFPQLLPIATEIEAFMRTKKQSTNSWYLTLNMCLVTHKM